MPGESIAGHIGAMALVHAAQRLWRIRFWRFKIFRPNDKVRVSFSALLRITDGGRYILVKNLHRPEVFGPFGGVYKFHDSCRSRLDEFEFGPQEIGRANDMRNDLRGFLPRKHLGKMLKWFQEHSERESAEDCLSREINEELREIRLHTTVKPPNRVEVRKVRIVEEGPEKVPGYDYKQFRLFEVYDLVDHSEECLRFVEQVRRLSRTSQHLVSADSSDLVAGRCSDGRVIGHFAIYLIRNKRVRPDAAPLVRT